MVAMQWDTPWLHCTCSPSAADGAACVHCLSLRCACTPELRPSCLSPGVLVGFEGTIPSSAAVVAFSSCLQHVLALFQRPLERMVTADAWHAMPLGVAAVPAAPAIVRIFPAGEKVSSVHAHLPKCCRLQVHWTRRR